MFPHERSLVARLKDEPFALIGVNSDGKNAAEMKNTKFKDEKLTWRHFWDGPDGTHGPIAKDWEINGWPTLYLIDAEGKLRKKWVGDPGEEVIDHSIDALVAEAKAKKPAAPKKQ